MKSEKANIVPVNGHLLIEPLENKSFIASDKTTYEEVGVVLAQAKDCALGVDITGSKVWFDSWLAGKYPTGEEGKYFWLVAWKDVKAVDGN